MSFLGGLRAITASRATGALLRPPPTFSNVKLLLHAQGTPGSQDYIDSSSFNRGIPAVAGVTHSSLQSYRGSSSLEFTGSGGIVIPPTQEMAEWVRLGSRAHAVTIEMSVFLTQSTNRKFLIGTGAWGISISPKRDGFCFHNNGSIDSTLTIPTLPQGEFLVLAFQISPSVTRPDRRFLHAWVGGAYRGGLEVDHPTIIPQVFSDHYASLRIGGDSTGNFAGYIDELRISEEILYPLANYTVEAGVFADSDGATIVSGGFSRNVDRTIFLNSLLSQESFGLPGVLFADVVLTGIFEEGVGAPSLSVEAALSSILSAQAVGLLTLADSAALVELLGIATQEGFGGLINTADLSLSGPASLEAIGSLALAPEASVVNPTFSNVKLLLHSEGVPGTQTYTDSSTYARALVGNSSCLVSTAQQFRGASSINISGGVNWSVPVDAGQGSDEWARMATDAHPLTVELALRLPSGGGGALMGSDGAAWWSVFMGTQIGGAWPSLLFTDAAGQSGTVNFIGAGITTDTWHMLAFAGRGTAHREWGVWLDGVWQGSVTLAGTPGITNGGNTALNMTRSGGSNQTTGYWDELRISEELFLPWGSNYVVNPSEFPEPSFDPEFANVQLLLHGDGSGITDSSSHGWVVSSSSGVTNDSIGSDYFGDAQLSVSSGGFAEWNDVILATTGTYTIEGFFTIAGFPSPRVHLLGCWDSGAEHGWTFDANSSGNLTLAVNSATASSSGTEVLLGATRYHLVLQITLGAGGTTGEAWVNGVSTRTFSGPAIGNLESTSTLYALRLGSRSDGTLPGAFKVEELRVTTGARYTPGASFTVPTTSYPNSSGVTPLTFVTGSSAVTYTNGDRTAESVSGWNIIPLSMPIPNTGKWYVEFDTSGLSGHQMLGVSAAGAVDVGFYLGQGGSMAAGLSKGDGTRLTGTTFSWAQASPDFSSAGTTSIGIQVDSDTGHVQWHLNGVLQITDATFTPGTSGLYFAIGSFQGRGGVTVKLAASATVPSGFTYLA